MNDAINKPAHYNQGSIECIEAMENYKSPEIVTSTIENGESK